MIREKKEKKKEWTNGANFVFWSLFALDIDDHLDDDDDDDDDDINIDHDRHSDHDHVDDVGIGQGNIIDDDDGFGQRDQEQYNKD